MKNRLETRTATKIAPQPEERGSAPAYEAPRLKDYGMIGQMTRGDIDLGGDYPDAFS